MKKLVSVLAVPLILAACASTPHTASTNTAQPASHAEAPKAATVSQADVNAANLARELAQLEKESVYFDFDKSIVHAEYHDLVVHEAQFLQGHQNDVVTLQGNCDERGSAEYNLALGSRRAHAVAHELQLLGVQGAQIKEVSFGNEKPRLTCHAEKCWKENRRVDFAHSLN